MNLFKKVIATIALTTLVATATVSSVSAYTNDSEAAAATLAAKGVIVDHSDNVAAYELGNLVKRQEVAAVAFAVAGLTKKTTCDNEFSDVTATTPNTWACYVVEALRDNGYLAKNAKFRPEANISKAEALGMMVSAAFGDAYKYDATKGTSWQEQLVDFAVNNNILDAAFTDYNTPATRGVVFQWTVNAMDAAVSEEDDLGGLEDLLGGLTDTEDTTDVADTTDTEDTVDTTDTVDVTVSTSDLMVEANPEMPAGSDLPEGADGVLVLKLDVTAGNEDTSITEFDFERTGFGENAADEISLFVDGTRLTKSKSFNSDDEANVTVSPALVVKAGETVTIDARIDTDMVDTDSDFAIKLTGVTASTNVEANEIISNTFTVKNTEATKLLFQTGSVNSQVTAGETDADVAEFDLRNDGNVSNSDITVTSITLKEEGTVDQETELANLKLVMNGQVLATVDSIVGKYVTFNLDTPVVIDEGKSETFTVTADITGGADKTINFVLDTDGDIVATATKYNAVNVVNEFVGGEVVDIQAGELTLYSIDAENDKIRDDKDDVVLGTLKIVNVAGQDLNIKNMGVRLVTSNSGVAQVLENVKAEINGTSYDLYAPDGTADDDSDVIYSDTDLDITLPQGTTLVTIMADTLDDLTDGTTITMSLDVNDTEFYVEETQDDNKVTDVTPSALSWDDVEIEQPKATVSKTPLADVTIVKGTSDVTALQFDVEANETSDLTIDKVNVVVSYAGGYGTSIKDYVSEAKLYKGSVSDANKLDSISGTRLGANGEANFDGFEVTVPADETETFIVVISTVDSDAVVNSVLTVSPATTNFLNVEDDENDTALVDNVMSAPYKEITLKDTGKLSLGANTSADNIDNENDKTILAGTEQVIFSIDAKATNEEIDLERIKFKLTTTAGLNDELRDSISQGKLYLGNDLLATTSNSKVTVEGDDTVYISFEDMTNTIVPTTSDELRLGIVTETIGYEKVGNAISSAKVSAVLIDENYAKGVESNDKVDVNEDGTIDTASVDTTSFAKELAIVPMIVTPSVSDTFGTDDINATLTIATDAGDNTTQADGDSLVATLKTIKIDLSSVTSGGTITLFNGNGDNVGSASIADTDTGVTITVDADEFISNGEAYRLETTAEASYRLAKDGVEYTVDGSDYSTRLDNTQDMGSYANTAD